MTMRRRLRPAVFLDKDGTLVDDVPYNVDPALVRLTFGARVGVRILRAAGYALVVASNQSGVARGLFEFDDLLGVRARIEQLLSMQFEGFYCCPHLPEGRVSAYAIACECRKPMPGLLERAADELGLDLSRSWMIGDIVSDVEAGRRAGCRTVLLSRGGGFEWRGDPLRTPTLVAGDLYEAARQIILADRSAAPPSRVA
jgi:D-glycero-D-manno-heptose 1,7-bisphosphate phosphatase